MSATRVALVAGVVTIAGGLPRVLLASGALPQWLRPFTWSDPLFVYERGLSGHRLPYVDTPFEYPPLIGGISGLFSAVLASPIAFVIAWVLTAALCAALTGFLLARATGTRRALTFALAPQLFLLGTVNFDLLAVALLVVAIVLQRGSRERGAMAALALGTAAKLFPLASVPLAALRDARRVAAIATFVFVLALAYAPTLLLPYSSAGGVGLYAVQIRSNIDSIWGLVERFLATVGVPGSDTIVLIATTVGLIATYMFAVVPRARRAADPATAFGLATLALLLWSRLYSPQYSLWVLPFFALLGLDSRRFALLVAADLLVFATIYPLTLVPRPPDDASGPLLLGLLAAAVVLRHFVLWSMWREVARGTSNGNPGDERTRGESDREDDRHSA